MGEGDDISFIKLAKLIKKTFRFQGEILTGITKPGVTPRNLLNTEKINKYGWKSKIPLEILFLKVYGSVENVE